ncbi:MAG: phosphoribosylamine--glycine ligase [Bacteroidales bacterium]|nr:phosphoribosylamine--glycine ligase [Bacteroidales bacterium]
MNILILGSGGREHALAWKIKQSNKTDKLYIAPGNAGTDMVGENVAIETTDFPALKQFVLDKQIDMVVVGPEIPLVKGVYDFFSEDADLKHIPVIGPSKEGAQLEGSKQFAKEFMNRHDIPTAKHKSITKDNIDEGIDFLESLSPPFVLKADGLAAGKGVIILKDRLDAINVLNEMLLGMFGASSQTVVIEEFLSGIECSVFVLTDGESYKILPIAKDYKRIGEGDTGLNTGGMGALSPVPFADEAFMNKVKDRVIEPTIEGLIKEDIDYKGFIFIGLISVNNEPYVIEYNVRLGDPESEVVIPRIKSDFVDLLDGVANGNLNEKEIVIDKRCAATVMLVSGGYPEEYEKNKKIEGLDKVEDTLIFHAGTINKEGSIYSAGGRVLAITSLGETKKIALDKSFKVAESITFDKKYYRKDIGFDIV